jgi:hypothetical protein
MRKIDINYFSDNKMTGKLTKGSNLRSLKKIFLFQALVLALSIVTVSADCAYKQEQSQKRLLSGMQPSYSSQMKLFITDDLKSLYVYANSAAST